MKLLLDENLPPALADVLGVNYPGSAHVHDCDFGSASDTLIGRSPRNKATRL